MKLSNSLIILANKLSFLFPDDIFLKLQFRLRMGYRLDLTQPKTISEKIQWLKLYNRNPKYTNLVDKYEVKLIVAKEIGISHIIPTIGLWDTPEEIDFECLPNQFVLKTTHGGGNSGVVICSDKSQLDKAATIKKLRNSLKQDIYKDFREWPYKNVRKRIIAEKYMSQEDGSHLIDYKFFCFNGTPKFVYVSQNIPGSKRQLSCFLTIDWTLAPFKKRNEEYALKEPIKPITFEEMSIIASNLSKGIPFVRVDLYEINGQIYFSELTFYPSSGMQPFEPQEWDYKLGAMLNLPQKSL